MYSTDMFVLVWMTLGYACIATAINSDAPMTSIQLGSGRIIGAFFYAPINLELINTY